MAFMQVNMLSQSLMRMVSVNVILPVDKMVMPGMPVREEKPYKTLYLLHGIFGNYMDWGTTSRIQRFAEEKNLVVVMPSGENAFYVDQEKANNFYGEFIGKELVEVTRKMFPLSRKKEDTFIGGLSMGGYGALRNGLKYNDNFGAIICLSGAFVTEDMHLRTNDSPVFFNNRDYAEAMFGDLSKVNGSDKDPKFLAKKLTDDGDKSKLPMIYIACGEDDFLLPANKDMYENLQGLGYDVTMEVGPGNHEWDFWDTYIKKAIDWLPTEEKQLGVGSGNILK